ncbi:MAG TPA: hypothetical protein DEA50_01550 [Parvularcula sp.]|nr:hypothetical protein [Parvularcula sp.]
MGLVAAFIQFFLSPFRALARFVGAGPARTVEKSGAGYVAKGAGEAKFAEDKGGEPEGVSFLFKRLARPMLVERTAADMTLEEAQEVSAEAAKFYTYPFPLFARADAFYEEIEQDYINAVLGRAEGSADANYLRIMDQFRRELNANTARLFLVYTPLMLAAAIGAALTARAMVSPAVEGAAAASAVIAVSLALLMLLYHWPYKVTQQQNLLGLDNYITSKFSRINQNFQVAKRRAMNVERNMRMPQAEQLKAEAGVWTVSYQWFAMRLLFCEMTVRNTLYQIRRNTTLYGVAGMAFSALLAGALAFAASTAGLAAWWEVAGAGAFFIVIAYLVIMAHATRETLSVLQPTEWNRFHLVDLHETIRDHVGEDKLQIVTFRDRNRLE